ILIEAWQRTGESARKPERPEDEQPLAVVHVGQDFTDTPLVSGIPIVGLRFRNPLEERRNISSLGFEDSPDISVGNLVDIGEVVLRRFRSFWSSHHRGASQRI